MRERQAWPWITYVTHVLLLLTHTHTHTHTNLRTESCATRALYWRMIHISMVLSGLSIPVWLTSFRTLRPTQLKWMKLALLDRRFLGPSGPQSCVAGDNISVTSYFILIIIYLTYSWLRRYAARCKVTGTIFHDVLGFYLSIYLTLAAAFDPACNRYEYQECSGGGLRARLARKANCKPII
jgi:hypothetical protein